MIKQYPHFLFVKISSDSIQDPVTGDWSAASESWVLHSLCREQTNGKGSVVNGADGKGIVFSALIHLPLSAVRIKENTEVLVSETDNLVGTARIEGRALKYDVGQLHCRLWV